VSKKPARKPAKKRRAAEVRGIPVGGGWIQPTLFPVVRRPDAEVRAEQDGEVLAGGIPIAVLDELRKKAAAILEDVQHWEMDRSVERLSPHPISRRPRTRVSYTAEESVLDELVEQIAAAAFKAAADRYRPEIAALVARLERQARLLEQRRDGGESLAEEGRAALKPENDARADRVCKLYRKIRDGHPPGRRGNGAAVAEVARQIGPLFDRDKPITTTAIRKILKRRGVPCR